MLLKNRKKLDDVITADEAMDAEKKEFDLDMDIIEDPLARP